MRFLVDAQLPYGLSLFLKQRGHDAIHTYDLPAKELTKDHIICKVAVKDNRVVITKDSDFYSSYILTNQPDKLLWVSTGNIRNKHLMKLFELNLPKIVQLFEEYSLIELDNDEITIHF